MRYLGEVTDEWAAGTGRPGRGGATYNRISQDDYDWSEDSMSGLISGLRLMSGLRKNHTMAASAKFPWLSAK